MELTVRCGKPEGPPGCSPMAQISGTSLGLGVFAAKKVESSGWVERKMQIWKHEKRGLTWMKYWTWRNMVIYELYISYQVISISYFWFNQWWAVCLSWWLSSSCVHEKKYCTIRKLKFWILKTYVRIGINTQSNSHRSIAPSRNEVAYPDLWLSPSCWK